LARLDSKFVLGLSIGVVAVGLIGVGAFALGRIYQAPAMPTLAQQQQCADAAARVFKDSANAGASFSSHYNAQYGRCFVEVYSHDDVHSFRSVSDAIEHTDYAFYVESIAGGEANLVECRTRLPNLPYVPCKSFEEWQNLVRPLMGSGALGSS
jgi:hypothetical protein